MALIRRKDENLDNKYQEIEDLTKRVREYMIIQDLLYRDYIAKEKNNEEWKKKLEAELRDSS